MDEPPGSYAICPICFWEDDDVQLRYPTVGGANHVSLIEAQRNFAEIGASEARVLDFVRPPASGDEREFGWRPIDLDKDDFEAFPASSTESFAMTYFREASGEVVNGESHESGRRLATNDSTKMYWWKPTFWNRDSNE